MKDDWLILSHIIKHIYHMLKKLTHFDAFNDQNLIKF